MDALFNTNNQPEFPFERDCNVFDISSISENMFPTYCEDRFELEVCKAGTTNFMATDFTQDSEYDQVFDFVASPLRKPSGTKSMLNMLEGVPETKKSKKQDLKFQKKSNNKKVLASKKAEKASSFTTSSSNSSSYGEEFEPTGLDTLKGRLSTFPILSPLCKTKDTLDLSFLREGKMVAKKVNTKDLSSVFESV